MSYKDTWIIANKWHELKDENDKKAVLAQAFDLSNNEAAAKLFKDFEFFEFLLAELKKHDMLHSLLKYFLTSTVLWDSNADNIFHHLWSSLNINEQNQFKEFALSDSSLVNKLVENKRIKFKRNFGFDSISNSRKSFWNSTYCRK